MVNFYQYITAQAIQLELSYVQHKLCNTVSVISRVPHNRLRVKFLSGHVIMVMSPGFAMILFVLRTMFNSVSINFNFITLSARVLLLIFIICVFLFLSFSLPSLLCSSLRAKKNNKEHFVGDDQQRGKLSDVNILTRQCEKQEENTKIYFYGFLIRP